MRKSDGHNCQCTTCGESRHINKSISIIGRKDVISGEKIKHDKNHRPIKCSTEGCYGVMSELPYDPEDNMGFGVASRYSAQNKEGRDASLKNRAKKHTKKILSGGQKEEIEKKHIEPVAKHMGGSYKGKK
tara:strand:- start:6157 stop:6546 length:390 start_codon:yes stop_codon:yes gene_type:complete